MLAVERRRLLLQAMERGNAVTVAELADRLHVSMMTIRRDLESLAGQGMLTRVHGGAVTNSASPQVDTAPRASFGDNAVAPTERF